MNSNYGSLFSGALSSRIGILFVLGAVFALRVSTLTGGLGIDETHYARAGLMLYSPNPYFNPTHLPATSFKLAIGLSQKLFGVSEFTARLPGFLIGLGSVYVTYEFARYLSGRIAGLAAASMLVLHPLYISSVPRALLDVPLAFFILGSLFFMCLYIENEETLTLVAALICVILGLTTKIHGFLYLSPIICAFVLVLYRQDRLFRLQKHSLSLVSIVCLMASLLYWPFLLSAPDNIPYERIPNSFEPYLWVIELPIIQNIAYVVGVTLFVNVNNVSGGRAMEVAGNMYEYTPVWTYIYWFAEHGGPLWIILFGACLLHVARLVYVRQTNLPDLEVLLISGSLVPFVLLSLLSVKYPRYLIPLLPIIAVFGVFVLKRTTTYLVAERFKQVAVSPAAVLLMGIIAIAIVSTVIAPATIAVVPETTENDYTYDDEASFILQYANQTNSKPVVLPHQPTPFAYYLDNQRSPWMCSQSVAAGGQSTACPVTTIRDFDYSEAELLEKVRTGEVDIVIIRAKPHAGDKAWEKYARNNGTQIHLIEHPIYPNIGVYELD